VDLPRRSTRVTHARVGGVVVGLALLAGCASLPPPTPLPAGSPSVQRRAHGPWPVARRDLTVVRPFVPTPGAPSEPRVLETTVWYPKDATEPCPLVVYSHGFMSNRKAGAYLAEDLASRGFVVAAPDHPHTRRFASDLRLEDLVNQPADVRAVIDRLADPRATIQPLPVRVDPARIGVMGLSLGAFTATVAAFHPRLGDPRVRAAVSIAGPTTPFGPGFFAARPVDFLMIAGGSDVIIDAETNAWPLLQRAPSARVVMIDGASHAGFDQATYFPLLGLENPDRLGCWMLARSLKLERAMKSPALTSFIRADDGISVPAEMPTPCAKPAPHDVLSPHRQMTITRLAVVAFFEATLGTTADVRQAGARYLDVELARDVPEVHIRRAPASLSSPPRAETAQPPPPRLVPVERSS